TPPLPLMMRPCRVKVQGLSSLQTPGLIALCMAPPPLPLPPPLSPMGSLGPPRLLSLSLSRSRLHLHLPTRPTPTPSPPPWQRPLLRHAS
ncbi:hypothetical protein M9458_014051, partial [Cirrhinus mrigala]